MFYNITTFIINSNWQPWVAFTQLYSWAFWLRMCKNIFGQKGKIACIVLYYNHDIVIICLWSSLDAQSSYTKDNNKVNVKATNGGK